MCVSCLRKRARTSWQACEERRNQADKTRNGEGATLDAMAPYRPALYFLTCSSRGTSPPALARKPILISSAALCRLGALCASGLDRVFQAGAAVPAEIEGPGIVLFARGALARGLRGRAREIVDHRACALGMGRIVHPDLRQGGKKCKIGGLSTRQAQ